MTRSTDEKIAAAKTKRDQAQARLQSLLAAKAKAAKREDTRRKVVAGAILLEHCEHDEAFKATVRSVLDQFLTRPVDRALFKEDFGIPPLDGAGPAASTPAKGETDGKTPTR